MSNQGCHYNNAQKSPADCVDVTEKKQGLFNEAGGRVVGESLETGKVIEAIISAIERTNKALHPASVLLLKN
jgi:hypothetical protein